MKVMVVFGTRPEAIKMAPLVIELKKRDNIETIVCVTGQHEKMLDQVLEVFHIVPDYNLRIMKKGQDLFDITTVILEKMKTVLENEEPDLVLVHGDTSTAFATALASFYKKILVGHVEAGLRTNNLYSPFPEEYNRQAIDIIADYLFVPTQRAKDNLIRENKEESKIYISGNTVIDALKTTVRNDYQHEYLEWVSDSRLIVLTAHRRENLGEPMKNIFSAINRILEDFRDVKIIYPIHLNPQIRELAEKYLKTSDRIRLVEPMDVLDFHNIVAKSYFVLTDSGGIQEEAPALGKPVLVMRDTTERPEGVEAGTLKLIGTNEDDIYREASKLLMDVDEYKKMALAVNPYGDGFASKRIADIVCQR